MEISRKHLEMIRFTLSNHIVNLEYDLDVLGADYIRRELEEYKILKEMIEDLIRRE